MGLDGTNSPAIKKLNAPINLCWSTSPSRSLRPSVHISQKTVAARESDDLMQATKTIVVNMSQTKRKNPMAVVYRVSASASSRQSGMRTATKLGRVLVCSQRKSA